MYIYLSNSQANNNHESSLQVCSLYIFIVYFIDYLLLQCIKSVINGSQHVVGV